MQNTQQLNHQFALDNALHFSTGPNGTVMINVQTPSAQAMICTYGAQVLSYKTNDAEQDLLFLSPQSAYGDGKAIRGGVPICWPWFGLDNPNQGCPPHGFARNQLWHVVETKQLEDGKVAITLKLMTTDFSQQFWPFAFELQFSIVIGETLKMMLTTRNCDKRSYVISQALHTYFNVGDISSVQLRGLSNHHYLDKTLNFESRQQLGDITFGAETDRVYLQTPEKLFIEDAAYSRKIQIISKGSKTTVVWNPWDNVVILKDMLSNAYQHFVCVETANTADDKVTLAPDQSHTLSAEYCLLAAR